MPCRERVGDFRKGQLLVLHEHGLSNRQVARRLGISEASVRWNIRKYAQTGSMAEGVHTGRPRKTTTSDDLLLKEEATRMKTASLRELATTLASASGSCVSTATVSRRLAENGVRPRAPAKTADNKVAVSLAKVELGVSERRTGETSASKRLWDAAVAEACSTEGRTLPMTGEEAFQLGVRHAKRLLQGAAESRPAAAVAKQQPTHQRLPTRSIERRAVPAKKPVVFRNASVPPPSSRDATASKAAASAPAARTAAAGTAVTFSAASDPEPPAKVQRTEQLSHKMPESVLHRCPQCSKTFMSRYGLVMHLDVHPKHAVRCAECEIVFPSHRSLLTHRRTKHPEHFVSASSSSRQLEAVASGCSSAQLPLTAQRVAAGFSDLTFADFSCRSFPLIAQHWCERRPRPSASTFHDFSCVECNTAFPIASALQLHKSKVHNKVEDHVDATFGRELSTGDDLKFRPLTTVGAEQSQFLQHLQLYPSYICSKEVCIDDKRLNTVYHSLLVKVAGCQHGSPSPVAVNAPNSAAACCNTGDLVITRERVAEMEVVPPPDVKNGQLRKSHKI